MAAIALPNWAAVTAPPNPVPGIRSGRLSITRSFDARYIVTSLSGELRHLREDVYCARSQAENLIKMHKGQLASDRPPARARSPTSSGWSCTPQPTG